MVVHGIGEQGRFEHLDGHIRGVIEGLRRTGAAVTVEIMSSPASAFQAAQETWAGAPHPALRLLVRAPGRSAVNINVHEVWWADINERYGVAKQIRFWLWGLSLWLAPRQANTGRPTTKDSMFPPRKSKREGLFRRSLVRLQLYGVGCLFLMLSATIGLGMNLAKRLLHLEPPNFVKLFANYLSSIKLYSQRHRRGTFLWSRADFVDTIGQPPRVSIRRRMIRTLADVACRDYDRWYVLAHSQGSVVAFNGLMEPAAGWPGFLDERRWRRLRARSMAGPARAGAGLSADGKVPPHPVWAEPDEIAYRRRIFAKFRGLLTYGCPLEKFATLWPGVVPVCREPAFAQGTRWINVFDPLDPVAGIMQSWPTKSPECCPCPENVGYAASGLLLVGHVAYLTCPSEPSPDSGALRLADGIAEWLLTGCADGITEGKTRRLFSPKLRQYRLRRIGAGLQWAAVTAIAASFWITCWEILFWIGRGRPFDAVTARMADVTGLFASRQDGQPAIPMTWPDVLADFAHAAIPALGSVALVTLLAGILLNILTGPRDRAKPPADVAFTALPSPEPEPEERMDLRSATAATAA